MTRTLAALGAVLAMSAPAGASGLGVAGAVTGTSTRLVGLVAGCSYVRTPAGVVVSGFAESPLAEFTWIWCEVSAGGVTHTAYEHRALPASVVAETAALPAGPVTLCLTARADWSLDVQEYVHRTCRTS